jgi:hypothetical protein
MNSANEIASAPDDMIFNVAAQHIIENSKMFGTDPTEHLQHLQRLLQNGGPQALRAEAKQAAVSIKDQLPKFQHIDAGGTQILGAVNPLNAQFTPTATVAKTATPGEMLTDKRVKDNQQFKIEHGISGLSPEENDALFGPKGAVTTGRLDPQKVNSRTAKIFAQGEMLNPGTTDFVALTGDAAINRNAPFRMRAMTAEVLPEIMTNMVEAGKKLNYPDAKFAGVIKQWAMGQMNDPDLTSYMTQRNDALMTIASVMRGNGMTDMAHKAEVEASNPTMSPAALDAWLEAQKKALEPRLKQNEKYARTTSNRGNESPDVQIAPKGVTAKLKDGTIVTSDGAGGWK